MTDRQEVQKLAKYISEQKIIKKHLYPYTWLSGSTTTVYPIMVWKHDIVVQLQTDRNYFNKFFENLKQNFPFITHCAFCKSDGSCPSTLRIVFQNFS